MVAYSFNRRFVEPILDETKRQTIRKPRKLQAASRFKATTLLRHAHALVSAHWGRPCVAPSSS